MHAINITFQNPQCTQHTLIPSDATHTTSLPPLLGHGCNGLRLPPARGREAVALAHKHGHPRLNGVRREGCALHHLPQAALGPLVQCLLLLQRLALPREALGLLLLPLLGD